MTDVYVYPDPNKPQVHDPRCTVQDYDHICGVCGKIVDCEEWHQLGKHKNEIKDDGTPEEVGADLSTFAMGVMPDGPAGTTVRDTTDPDGTPV